MEKIFAQVGSFAMKPGSQKGIHLFAYEPEQAIFTHIGDFRPEINAGQNSYNPKQDMLYITHESKDEEGGAIHAFKLDPETGKPVWINTLPTCANLPSYVCATVSGKYLVVPHHGTGAVIAKTVQNKDGKFELLQESDDGTVALIRLREDGSLGEICDVYWHEILRENVRIKKIPHLHSCVQSPDGRLFLVCDKGLDQVHSYHIDEENGKLQLLCSTSCEEGSHPRYAVFHPTLPVCYQNNEASAFLNVWDYDSESGKLNRRQRIGLLESEEESAAWTKEGASDLRVTADGRNLYAAVRGLNLISVFDIKEDGCLKFIQNISCNGQNPRGICLSPDDRYLFSLNRDTENIARFLRNEDGTLTDAGAETACILPGNMQFIVYK